MKSLHTAEMHYKKHYHLKFVHARKLFLFDIILLFSTILIFCLGLFWFFYNPTITDLVYLSITPQQERLVSGQQLTYTIAYTNESDITLTHPLITLDLPPGLTIEQFEPSTILFDTQTNSFTIPSIKPHESGLITFSGIFFATPHTENIIHATLSYMQDGKEFREQKTSPAITILRDSILKTELDLPRQALGRSSIPFTITLTNMGDITLYDLTIPTSCPRHTTCTFSTTTVSALTPQAKTTITGIMNINAPHTISVLDLSLTPSITFDNIDINQKTITQTINLLHPNINITSSWDDIYARPGDTRILTLELTNTSDITLSNIQIIANKTAYTTSYNKTVTELKPQQTTSLEIPLIIHTYTSSQTDIILTIPISLIAHIADISPIAYTREYMTPTIPIGTDIVFNAELRYYTNEGDQLGRGPLPPQVGKETKYWAFLKLHNTTSHIRDIYMTATLPHYVTWTGKTSVSHGQDVQYNPTTKQLTWSHANLNPHTTAGIYVELALTPTSDMQRTTPTILQNISTNAHDTYINLPLSRTATSLDISLPTDPIGSSKGILIQ